MSTSAETLFQRNNTISERRRPAGLVASVALIAALHFFGWLGMHWPVMDQWLARLTPFSSFLSLTPLNLLLCLGLLLAFHQGFTRQFGRFAAACLLTGYWIEVAGVHTGVIFGSYYYGEVLGIKLLQVPLLIGVNWLILVYCTSEVTRRFINKPLAGAAVAAALMVLLDVLIEPVAIYFGMWLWETPHVPLQNYLAWYVISFVLCYLFFLPGFGKRNPLAPVIYVAQFLFFAAHNLVI